MNSKHKKNDSICIRKICIPEMIACLRPNLIEKYWRNQHYQFAENMDSLQHIEIAEYRNPTLDIT